MPIYSQVPLGLGTEDESIATPSLGQGPFSQSLSLVLFSSLPITSHGTSAQGVAAKWIQ